jgi:hypothetical protein
VSVDIRFHIDIAGDYVHIEYFYRFIKVLIYPARNNAFLQYYINHCFITKCSKTLNCNLKFKHEPCLGLRHVKEYRTLCSELILAAVRTWNLTIQNVPFDNVILGQPAEWKNIVPSVGTALNWLLQGLPDKKCGLFYHSCPSLVCHWCGILSLIVFNP